MIRQFRGKYSPFSNFSFHTVALENIVFPTGEHAFQCYKAKTEDGFDAVLEAPTPSNAKRIARQIDMRDDWEEVKDEVMYNVIKAKVEQHRDVKELLLSTGDEEIQEGNTWGDEYWGVSLPSGRGRNQLGKTWMRVRRELQNAQ